MLDPGIKLQGLGGFAEDSFAVFETEAFAGELNDFTAVKQRIQQSGSDDLVTDSFHPFLRGFVSGNDQGDPLMQGVDKVEEGAGFIASHLDGHDIVQDDQMSF